MQTSSIFQENILELLFKKYREIPSEKIMPVIKKAVKEAEDKGIKGRDITPFLLKRIADITEGSSLKTNIELIKNNTIIGTDTAIALSKIKNQS